MEKITNTIIGDFFMKKKMLIFIAVFVLVIMLLPKHSSELRIRVIAASDSSFDQKLKMDVVSVLKAKIRDLNQKNIRGEVIGHLDEFDGAVNNLLKDYDYTISVENVRFPAKELQGKVIPGGVYETLLVVIGEGKGKNWWSVLYPEYHGISFEDVDTGDVEFRFYFFDEIKKLLSGS